VSVEHGFDREFKIEPNDEPERGRVKVVATCECGEHRAGFARTAITAWSRALCELRDHIEEAIWVK